MRGILYAAIDGYICMPDCSSNYGFRLRGLTYNKNTNTFSDLYINYGNNYAWGCGVCYLDNNNDHCYQITYNSGRNAPAVYNLDKGTYTRTETSTHDYIQILTNDYEGVHNKKLAWRTTYQNANVWMCIINPSVNPGSGTHYNSTLMSFSTPNTTALIYPGVRYNNPLVYGMKYTYIRTSTRMSNYTYRNVEFDSSFTSVTQGADYTSKLVLDEFRPLYINDDLTKFWTFNCQTMNIELHSIEDLSD